LESGVTDRTCPAPGCGNAIPAGRFACPRDWARLPADLRGEINKQWTRRRLKKPGAISAHINAKTAAERWLGANPA
jgi:hypothetical protein